MNTPSGFIYKNGVVSGIDPIAAMLNPSTGYETSHMILASFEATGFGVAALCAWGILRGRKDTWLRKGLMLSLGVGLVVAPIQIISGDLNARFVAKYQPTKFAAMEGIFQTQKGAPITIGGWPDPKTGKTYYAIEIPHALSILVADNPNAVVQGLNAVPVENRPDPRMVHIFFDMMVGSGFATLAAAFWFFIAWWRNKKRVPENSPWLMRALMAAGPLTFFAIECGWIVTEEGRQPWVIQGFLRTKDAATTAPGINLTFLVFSMIYVALAFMTVILLRRLDDTNKANQQDNSASDTSTIPGGQPA